MKKFLQTLLEILGWLQITLGPTVVAGIIGFIVYIKWPGNTSKSIAIVLVIIGFTSGAIWATRIWKKYGTVEWLSSIRRIS